MIFQQDRQLGSQTFVLTRTHLKISGGVGLTGETIIELADICAEYEEGQKRFKRFYLVPLFLSGLSGTVSWTLFKNGATLGSGITAGITGFMALGFLLYMRFTPVEIARFRDVRGHVLFEICRPLKGAHSYDEFIAALVAGIKNNGSNGEVI